nr:unnamed protein product [Spirometra erinaceieuropaei]
MADHMMQVERLSSTTAAQVSQPLTASASEAAELKTQIVELSATSAALQLRRVTDPPPRCSFSRDRRRFRSRPRTANLCLANLFGDKVRHCVPPCFLKSLQGNFLAGESSASLSFLEKYLAMLSHVYLRCDQFPQPLEPPYDGTFQVLSQGTKTFRIQRVRREAVVSADCFRASVPVFPSDAPYDPHLLQCPILSLFPLLATSNCHQQL